MKPEEEGMEELVGAIDQGTSSSRFFIFSNGFGKVVASHQVEVTRITPQQGWVEQDASELLNSVLLCMSEVSKSLGALGISPSSLKTIGITNQRETIVAWDKGSGEPLYNAIVWMDTRTSGHVERLIRSSPKDCENIRSLTGLPISTYFSSTKLAWMLENVERVRVAMEEGRCVFGTIDSWLLWNLTGKFYTDVTNASRTQLMNLQTLQWDEHLCKYFKVPMNLLPEIKSSSELFGGITEPHPFAGTPISGILGDQQAALVGQRCFEVGSAKCTYGTACCILYNTGQNIIHSRNGLLTTVAYQMGPHSPPIYAVEGGIATAGAAIQWLRDNLGFASNYAEIVELSQSVEDTGGVYFVPAFSGLFAPFWRSDARGVICGLTEKCGKAHIGRAAYESIAFQIHDILGAMEGDCGTLKALRVDGGMTRTDAILQAQSDILGIPITRPGFLETTALGAAIAAAAAGQINVWKQPQNLQEGGTLFIPRTTEEERVGRYARWGEAIKKSFGLNNA